MSDAVPGRLSGPLRVLLVLLVLIAVPVVAGVALLKIATQPVVNTERQDPADLLLQAEEVHLTAADGVALSAWYVRGRGGHPAVVLCHDLGGNKSQLLNEAVVLNKAGFPVLLIDFRRHGDSAAARTTLGVTERQDVLAAAAWLKGRPGADPARLGGWGVGMGAYALALAAMEDASFKALALDSIYPDVEREAGRLVRDRIPPALRFLVPVATSMTGPYLHCRIEDFDVAKRLTALSGRNVLFISGSETPERAQEEKALYEALPEGRDGGKNLMELGRSGLAGLYAGDRTRYDTTLQEFFRSSLGVDGARAAEAPKVEVIEK